MPALNEVFQPDLVEFRIGPAAAEITVRFDRSKVNLAWLGQLRDAAVSLEAGRIGELLALVIDAWDLTADDGSPYPPSSTNIVTLPSGVLRALSDSILERSAPASDEGKDLPALSSIPPGGFTPQAQISQNGPPTSRSPAPSTSPFQT